MENNKTSINNLFTKEEKWLIDLLFRDQDIEWNSSFGDENSMLKFSYRQGLAPLLYLHKASDSLSKGSINYLKSSYISLLSKNSAMLSIADIVVKKLQDNNIDSVLLKGAFLSQFVYDDSALRFMSDIDILIREENSKEAYLLFDTIEKFNKRDKLGHHLPTVVFKGIPIEIHTALIDRNLKYTIPMDAIWQGIEKNENKNCLTLCPVHLFVYQILHIYYSFRLGMFRLSWFYDLKLIIQKYNLDINNGEVIDFVNKYKLKKPYNLIISYYKVLIGNHKIENLKTAIELHDKLEKIVNNKDKNIGYSLALERIYYAKTLSHKFTFLSYLLKINKDGDDKNVVHRFFFLIKKFFKYLTSKK